jgi:glutathionylspermidine synthase
VRREHLRGAGRTAAGAVFKLYPWERMVREEFRQFLAAAPTLWIEPPWKTLLSNKGFLPVLWELYPGHPNLLEVRFDEPGSLTSWVRKPSSAARAPTSACIGREATSKPTASMAQRARLSEPGAD